MTTEEHVWTFSEKPAMAVCSCGAGIFAEHIAESYDGQAHNIGSTPCRMAYREFWRTDPNMIRLHPKD